MNFWSALQVFWSERSVVEAELPLEERHVPLIAKHPAARFQPFAAVEVAVVEVRLSAVPWIPPVNVEVEGEPKVAAPVEALNARAATDEVAVAVEVAR